MKRILCLALSLCLLLGLVACGKSEKKEEASWKGVEGLHAGFAQVDITPENGTPMSGYGHPLTKLSTGALHKLYATCLALSDGEDAVLLIAFDTGSITENMVTEFRQRITEETGVPEKQIILFATHSHSAPDIGASVIEANEQAAKCFQQWIDGASLAAKNALADLAPASVSGSMVQTEGLAFVRHYILAGGSVAGDNFGNWNAGRIEEYTMDNDPQLVLAKFERENKNDILLMNFQVHPTFTAGDTLTTISSDAVGVTRDYVKAQTGMDVIYFTGAAGNQNINSKILADAHDMTIDEWSEKLGNYAIEALDSMTELPGDDIKITHEIYTGDVWKVTDEDKVAKAEEVYKLFQETDRDTATPLAKQYGLASVYEAREIIRHYYNLADTLDMEINAISVGGLGLVTAPYEMFSLQGTYIKTNSPFQVTAVLGYAGTHRGYIPAKEAYDYGCYESQTAYYVAGTAEILAEKYVQLLQSVQ